MFNGENIKFAVPYRLADVTLRLDLTNFDFSTKTGAKFTVTVVKHHDHVYRVAGDATLCGSTWDATDDNNRMTYNEETGRFEKVYTDVAANPITGYEYKIVVDGATRIPDGPGSNPTVDVYDDNATVTIWYDEETGEWGADVAYGTSAPQQYTVTYDPGEYGTGSIEAGVKTYDEPFTLSSETFTWDGYVQTGWVDKETGTIYDLGDTYTLDADVTLYPVWDKVITVTAPFTTTVKLSDVGVPGEKTFTLALIGDSAPNLDKSDVSITGSVTTNGKGSYNGTLTFTGPERKLWVMLSEGAFVQQVDDGEAGWTYDDTVWGVLMEEIPVAYAMGDDATASGYTVYVVPASIDGNGYYYIDWDTIDREHDLLDEMTFTNTYTAHAYTLKYNADSHWDECGGCGDIQNKKFHKYGDWKVTKEATETEEGEKVRSCTVCDYHETAEIAKLTGDKNNPDNGDKNNPDNGDNNNPDNGDKNNPDTGDNNNSDNGDNNNSDTGTMASPQTDDNSRIELWFILLAASVFGLVGTAVYSRRKRVR